MIIALSTPLVLDGVSHSTVKVGKFEIDSDHMLDVHVLSPMAKRALKVWRGADYDVHQNWSNDDVAAAVNALHAAGELAKCFMP